jgi:hypothetical protein
MTQVVFTNPADGTTYTWPRNPQTEGAAAKPRNIERTSKTGNVGATKQQGDDGPYILDWTVEVLYSDSTAFETALWDWYVLCQAQTIYVTDWFGDQYEGQIVTLSRQRQLGPLNGQPWVEYLMQFEVYRFISGPLATAGVQP